MKFKKGDIVRCINGMSSLKLNIIYIISKHDFEFVYLDTFNNPNLGGWLPERFKHVDKKNMTEKEKTLYINYKLGAK